MFCVVFTVRISVVSWQKEPWVPKATEDVRRRNVILQVTWCINYILLKTKMGQRFHPGVIKAWNIKLIFTWHWILNNRTLHIFNIVSAFRKIVYAVHGTQSIRAIKKQAIHDSKSSTEWAASSRSKLPVFDLKSLLQLCLMVHSTSSTWGWLGPSSSASRWSCWYFLLKKPNCEGDMIREHCSLSGKKKAASESEAAGLTFHSSPTTRASSSRPATTLPTITPTGTSAFSPGLLTVSGTCAGGAASRFVVHN